jgi:hypothetical protein
VKTRGDTAGIQARGRKPSDKEREAVLSQVGESESEIRRFAKAGAIK